jgi:hypothetical protein
MNVSVYLELYSLEDVPKSDVEETLSKLQDALCHKGVSVTLNSGKSFSFVPDQSRITHEKNCNAETDTEDC